VFAQSKADSDYVKAIYRISELVQYRQLRPWLHPQFIWKLSTAGKESAECLSILHGFTDRVIKEKKEERKERKHIPSRKDEKDEDIVGRNFRIYINTS